MIKKIIFICIAICVISCSSNNTKLNNISYQNIKYDANNIPVSNSKRDFCILFFCSNYTTYDINDFVYETIKKANDEGKIGNSITNIELKIKRFNIILFSYRSIKIKGDIVDVNED